MPQIQCARHLLASPTWRLPSCWVYALIERGSLALLFSLVVCHLASIQAQPRRILSARDDVLIPDNWIHRIIFSAASVVLNPILLLNAFLSVFIVHPLDEALVLRFHGSLVIFNGELLLPFGLFQFISFDKKRERGLA